MNGGLELTQLLPELAAQAQWSVAELAGMYGVSVKTLERRCRETLGVRPREWMIRLRLEQARTRLQNGATVSAASYDAGYPDPSHFARAFKKHFGQPPSFHRLPVSPQTGSPAPEVTKNGKCLQLAQQMTACFIECDQ
ncbi:MAG: helix-turn-helix transcriptional regulator [Verrucomicrobiae bacterium]|nr:helix-turn-helix transcriptional regulator [Verrucomicrobiae bacterium]